MNIYLGLSSASTLLSEREKVNDRIVERKNSLFNLYEEAICMFAVNKTSIAFQTSLGILILIFNEMKKS